MSTFSPPQTGSTHNSSRQDSRGCLSSYLHLYRAASMCCCLDICVERMYSALLPRWMSWDCFCSTEVPKRKKEARERERERNDFLKCEAIQQLGKIPKISTSVCVRCKKTKKKNWAVHPLVVSQIWTKEEEEEIHEHSFSSSCWLWSLCIPHSTSLDLNIRLFLILLAVKTERSAKSSTHLDSQEDTEEQSSMEGRRKAEEKTLQFFSLIASGHLFLSKSKMKRGTYYYLHFLPFVKKQILWKSRSHLPNFPVYLSIYLYSRSRHVHLSLFIQPRKEKKEKASIHA